MIKKILVFLKSWHLLDEGQHYSCIVCGPDDFYQRNFFKNDYIFADILNSNPIVLRYFFLSLKIFFKNLFKIKFTLSNCRYLFLVSSLTPYIYKKKIKSIICFIDYYKIGKIFKLVLGNDINLIGFQFSVRGKPSLRYNLINNYDFYYLWDEMEKKLDTYQNNKIIKFGSLKSCAALEINKKWEVINHEYRKSNKILLISSIAENYEFFFTKYLSKKNTNIEEKLKSLIKKFDKKDFKLMREQQAFDFFRLCILLKKYLVKTKKPLEIILRGTKKNFNRLNYEKLIYKKIFEDNKISSFNFIEKNFIDRFDYALKNRDEIFLTDCSSFGKELLSVGCKVIFYSNIGENYVPFFYDYETIFCTNEKKNNFEKNIEELSKFNKLDFNIELKKTKKTFSSFTPNYKKFTDFLSQSNLTIREKIS